MRRVRLKRLRMRDEDLTAICHRTKKKTKPEFQLGRFPWKARVIIETANKIIHKKGKSVMLDFFKNL